MNLPTRILPLLCLITLWACGGPAEPPWVSLVASGSCTGEPLCDGDKALYCEGATLAVEDCTTRGLTCLEGACVLVAADGAVTIPDATGPSEDTGPVGDAAACTESATCDDEDPCTDDDCTDGACTHVEATCDDGDPCTDDSCDPTDGCVAVDIDCDDGQQCTTDACVEGTCQHDPTVDEPCINDDPCTVNDKCLDANLCVGTPNEGPACGGGCSPTLSFTGAADTFGRGEAYDVEVDGNSWAYLATTIGLEVYNVTDPATPKPFATIPMDSSARAIHITGNTAYVACREDGLHMVNITNPVSPNEVSVYSISDALVYDVSVEDAMAVVVIGPLGLAFVDVTDPALPTKAGDNFKPDGTTRAVDVVGTTAYVATSLGLVILDITDPTSPGQLGEISGFDAQDVTVDGGHAYVADAHNGLRVIDVSNPASPTQVGETYPVESGADRLVVDGDLVHLISGGVNDETLVTVDISAPEAPTEQGTYESPGHMEGLTANGTLVFVADGTKGLRVVDLSATAGELEVGSHDASGKAVGIWVDQTQLYVADGAAGVRALSALDPPTSLTVSGTLGSALAAQDVVVSGTIAYVADATSGLRIIDLDGADGPSEVTRVDTDGSATAVTTGDGQVFVADGAGGLAVIDVSDPLALDDPSIVTVSPASETSKTVDVSRVGSSIYVVDDDGTLRILDANAPSSAPTTIALGGALHAVTIAGDHAVCAAGDDGVLVVDLAASNQVGSLALPGDALDVTAVGDHVYVAAGAAGLHVVDISTPSSPSLVTTWDTPGSAEAVVVFGPYAYVADGAGLVQVIEISCPE